MNLRRLCCRRCCCSPDRCRYTRRQLLLFVNLACGNFFAALCGSLQAPFFPREAEKKGASPTGYGFVFGVFHLAIFLTSPIFGRMITRVTPKFMLNAGMFVVGVCSLLFGVLNYAPDGTTFLVLALVVRIMEGIGSSAYRTSAFTIVAAEFDDVASHFGSLETMYGLGLIIGPTIGGALYELHGYSLPFIVCGAALLLCALTTAFVIPEISPVSADEEEDISLFKFLKQPVILANVFMVAVPALCVGFNQATLEPHLRQFGISPLMVGVIFVINGMSFAMSTPIWGILCDRQFDTSILSGVGNVMSFACFFVIGPVPFVPLQATMPLVVASLVFFGFGMGAVRVTGFSSSLEEARRLKMHRTLAVNGMVSGVITSSVSMGLFFGPITGGVMVDTIGYRGGTMAMSALLFTSIIVSLVTFATKRVRRRQEEAEDPERTPLVHRPCKIEDSGKGESVTTCA